MYDCANLEDYLGKFGSLLGRQASRSLKPLHTPRTDRPLDVPLLRKPFEAQAHVVTAAVKALRRQKAIIVVGEMGTGKTLIGMAAVHAHAAGQPYNALVFCPGQLVKKWEREIRETIPDVDVRQIESFRDLLGIERSQRPDRSTWWVIARDRAKLGAKWRAAYATRGRLDTIPRCPRCWEEVKDTKGVVVMPGELHKRKTACPECGEPLWQQTSEIRRYEPAKFIHKKLREFFQYLVLDEVHEEKAANTAQANAAGALVAASDKVIALTGTLIGGYAEHIRPTLFRLAPRTLVNEGLTWSGSIPFNERYGRIETRITEREGCAGDDNRQSRGSSRSKTKYVRPGIMPTLFGRHLIGNSVFLGLSEVAESLPALTETVLSVPMDPELSAEYSRIEEDLTDAIKGMIVRGDRRLLGTMLQTLLCYPDHPYGWDSVGYYEGSDGGSGSGKGAFVTVTEPANLSSRTVRPKERNLVDLVCREVFEGRQAWVFVQLTDKRDVAARLEELLGREGLRVKVLRSSVPLSKREAWIERHGGEVDVVISHPRLVETGLDLFSKKPGGHNFATLVFYETGYNLFTLRQASRRAWRIGQRQDCRVYYLYYDATMQARAMNLMGRKLAAAQAVEGKFSSAGLVAMAGEDGGSVEMQLAKSLAERLDDVDASREWEKVAVVKEESETLRNGSAGEPTDDALTWLDSDEFAALFGAAA